MASPAATRNSTDSTTVGVGAPAPPTVRMSPARTGSATRYPPASAPSAPRSSMRAAGSFSMRNSARHWYQAVSNAGTAREASVMNCHPMARLTAAMTAATAQGRLTAFARRSPAPPRCSSTGSGWFRPRGWSSICIAGQSALVPGRHGRSRSRTADGKAAANTLSSRSRSGRLSGSATFCAFV